MQQTSTAKSQHSKITSAPAFKPEDLHRDNEIRFLEQCITGYAFWKGEAEKVKQGGGTGEREKEYAEFYRIGINKFSQIENDHFKS